MIHPDLGLASDISKITRQFRGLPPLTKLFAGLGACFAVLLAIGMFSAEEPPKNPGVASANVASSAVADEIAEEKAAQAQREAREAAARRKLVAERKARAKARAIRRDRVRKLKERRAKAVKLRRERAKARAERRRQLALEEEQSAAEDCHPSYEGACLDPNASDYDCSGGSGDGPEYTGYVQVVGPDVFDLDRDGDGAACESS